jgi:hypothetical protein
MIPEAERFKTCLGTYLKIDDWQALEIVLAAVVAHKIKGEMLWLRIIGASGSGKTEILRACMSQNGYTETMEMVTPSAIRRGMQLYKKDASGNLKPLNLQDTLIQRINGKLVITKELAPILTKQHDAKMELFGLLRSLHDGELDADYGSMQGHLKQKCWFDWILGTTTYVDSQNQLEMQLGSRFVDLRWGSPVTRKTAIGQAIDNLGNMEYIRNELTANMATIINCVDTTRAEAFKRTDWLLELCDIVAHFRTAVGRDKNKEIDSAPMPEVGTRVGQNLARIAKGLILLGVEDIRPYMVRLSWDAIPPVRVCVLKAAYELEQKGKKVTQEALAEHNELGLSQQYISTILSDFKILRFGELPWREHLCCYIKEDVNAQDK